MGNVESSRRQFDDDAPLPKQKVVKLTEHGTLEGGNEAETDVVQRQAQSHAAGYRPPFVLLNYEFRNETDSDYRFVATIGRQVAGVSSPGSKVKASRGSAASSGPRFDEDLEVTLHILPRLSDTTGEWPLLIKDGHAAFAQDAAKLQPISSGAKTTPLGPQQGAAKTSGALATQMNASTGASGPISETREYTVASARQYVKFSQWSPNLFVPDQQKMRWPLALELRPKKSGSTFAPRSRGGGGLSLDGGPRQRGGSSSNPSPTGGWADEPEVGDALPPEGTLLYFFAINARTCEPKIVEKFLVGPSKQVFHVQDLFGGEEEDTDCVICMSATCDTFVMPCKHLCLCSDCAMTLQLRMLTTQNGQTAVRCPLCRGDITNCIKLNGRSRSGSGVQLPEQQQRGNQAIPNHSASGSGTTTAAPLSDGTSSGIRAENLQTAERILNEPEPANGGSTWLPWVGRENYRDGDVAHNNPIVRRRVENLIVDARGGQQATGTSGERNSQQQGGGRTPVARISGEQQNQMEMTQIVSEGTGTQQAPETSTNAPAASPNRLAATANVVASRTNTGSASGSSSSPSRRASREENQGGNQGGFASLNFAEDIANAFRSMRIRGAEEQSAIPARTVKRIKAEWRSLDAAKERLRKEGFAFARISSFSHTTSINPVMPITSSATAASSSSSSSSAPPDTSPAPGGPSTTEGDMRFLQVSILTSGVPEDSHLGREMRRSGVAQLDFEVMFTDHFPMEAPKLRLVRPTVSMGSFWVQKQGALCMELLSADGWSPALSVEQMAFSVRAMMMNCNSGTVYPNTTYDDRQAAHEESKNIDKSHAGNYANMAS